MVATVDSVRHRGSRNRKRGAYRAASLRRVLMVAEAAALLTLARILIRCLPFRTLSRRAVAGGSEKPDISPGQEATAARIRAAIRRAASSWAVCLPQALAANWMLRWRGIGSTLCLGVRRDPHDGRMNSHAWLRVGDSILIGGSQACNFVPVAELPLRRQQGKVRT